MDDSLNREVRVYPDLGVLSRGAAEQLVELVHASLTERIHFSLVLAGGKTPRTLYRLFATEYRDRIPWARVHFFWSDERYVPPEDVESNYHLVRESLLNHIPLPALNVHPMPTLQSDPDESAKEYEATLRTFFSDQRPEFDLILLGVGTDGHCASLFPGSPALRERDRWVVSTRAPIKPQFRLSLTLPALNSARNIFFLVSGEEKREIVQSILQHPEQAEKLYPAAIVRPRERILWFLDEAAGGNIQ
jgi:6-phosphogluconolactonase